MNAKNELMLRINPDERSIRVENINDGVTSFKEITIETFYDCVKYSIRHEGVRSGFLPQNCFHVSVSENEDILTETLASIYLKQGKLKKAVNIFKRLSLKYPEKSDYFASRIADIQKQIN